MKKTFYSNGKLLIAGEYVVLDGGKAFALPTKFGQDLVIEDGLNKEIKWTSFDSDGSIWFEDTISFSEIINYNVLDAVDSIKSTLIEILHRAYLSNPDFIDNSEGYTITTHLTFPKLWGLGTSSTLINNIAQWLDIDAYRLLKYTFGGSGYDIACAQNDSPILYQLVNDQPVIEVPDFHPDFTEHLYFVYLNKKQSSKTAIAAYYNKQNDISVIIPSIDRITGAIINAPNLGTFAFQLENHESEMKEVLEMQTVKEAMFPDYKRAIKSLGAWGGDFVLVASEENPTHYFEEKGFYTVITYQDMILDRNKPL
jgi:mevalonate kinase